jgi:hypothetical protein
MPNLYYPCCEVGNQVPFTDGPLKANCWNCGLPDYIYVTNMDGDPVGYRYYSFTFNARMIRPTGEPPPWRF